MVLQVRVACLRMSADKAKVPESDLPRCRSAVSADEEKS